MSSKPIVKDYHRQRSSESGLNGKQDTKFLSVRKKDSEAAKLNVEEAPEGSWANLDISTQPSAGP